MIAKIPGDPPLRRIPTASSDGSHEDLAGLYVVQHDFRLSVPNRSSVIVCAIDTECRVPQRNVLIVEESKFEKAGPRSSTK